MRIQMLAMVVAGLALAAPVGAVTFNVTPGTVKTVLNNNFFRAQLTGIGLSRYTHNAGTSVSLSGPATLTFEYIGSESGFHNMFTVTGVGGFSRQEVSGGIEHWNAAGADFGTALNYAAGVISNWQFSSPGRPTPGPFGIGTEQFGIFLPSSSGVYSSSVLYLGFDDEPGSDDDNHDDMIIRVTATPFVDPQGIPEPSSWAMLIAGFGLVGAAQRKRKAIVTA